MAGGDERARAAVERLAEDESLRGELSDFGFGPLLAWGEAAVETAARSLVDPDSRTRRVREVLRAVAAAAATGRVDDAEPFLDYAGRDGPALVARLRAVSLGDDPDENAVRLVAVLPATPSAVPTPLAELPQKPTKPAPKRPPRRRKR